MRHTHHSSRHRGRSIRIVAILALVLIVTSSCASIDGLGLGESSDQHLTLAGSRFGLTTLDPALVRDAESAFISRQIFRGLVQLDEFLQPVPDIAREINVSDDGLHYRFTLHEEASFHDGMPIDAEAVVESFNRAADPTLLGGGGTSLSAATYFADIEGIDARLSGEASTISGIRAVDARTVEFALKRPAVNFLGKLTGSPAAIVDVERSRGSDWWQEPNGSGPFKVDHYTAGSQLHLAANEDFFAGRPRLDGVTILLGSAASQPMNLYESGEIDVTGVPGWAVDRVLSPGDILHSDLVVRDQLSTTFIAMNPNQAPYDDPAFRRMIAHVLDVGTMAEVAFDNRVERAYGLIPPGIGGTEWPADARGYDLDSALALRDTIGPLSDVPTLYEPGGGIGVILQTLMARDLHVQLNVIDQLWPEFSESLTQRTLPAFVLTWIADYPDPENTLAALLHTGSADNYLSYSNPVFDELVEAASVEPDESLRRDLYLQAQQVAIDDAVVIPLYHGKSYTLVQPWVRDLTITEIGILTLENVWIEDE